MTTRTEKPKSKPTKATPKTNAIMEYLNNEGYRPRLDSKGYIQFLKEGELFVCWPFEDDAPYLQMVYCGLRKMPAETSVPKVLWAINEVNRIYKNLKLTHEDGSVYAAAELMVYSVSAIAKAMERAIEILSMVDNVFSAAMAKAPDAPPRAGAPRKQGRQRR